MPKTVREELVWCLLLLDEQPSVRNEQEANREVFIIRTGHALAIARSRIIYEFTGVCIKPHKFTVILGTIRGGMVITSTPTRLRHQNFRLINAIRHIEQLAQLTLDYIVTKYTREIYLTQKLRNVGWHVRKPVRVI